MNISIPPALNPIAPMLVEFFEAMVHKLNVNSHKDAINEDDIDGLLEKLGEEIKEFREQRIQDANDPNILFELADVSNFSFLLYAFLRARGVKDVKERFIEEFFDIDVTRGKVMCRKTRSGSPLKVGEEVQGQVRNGRVYIRAQHSATGASISVPRSDLVYWAWCGQWPSHTGVILRHENGDRMDDRIENLNPAPLDSKEKLPFVSQYKPKGRENTVNYGKWIYQRRHAFKLIRVGYWDSESEAAEKGLKAWKEKVKETTNV